MHRAVLGVVAILACSSAADAKVLYESDFPAGPVAPAALKEWQLGGGAYRLLAGWLCVTSDNSNPQATLKITHDGDGTFRATVRNAPNCHRTALLAKGAYRLEINRQFTRLGLERLAGTQWKLVGEAGGFMRFPRDRHEFELRLVFAGRKVYGFIDDKKLIEYTDPDPVPAGGQYGLQGGWGTDVAWRGIRLSDEPDLSEWPYEPAPKPAPKGLVEVTWIRGLADDNVYFDKEKAVLRFKVTTRRAEGAKVRLTWRLVDVRQQTVEQKSEDVALRAGAETALSAEFTPAARGCFKVALYAGTADGDAGWVEDLGSFTVLSRAVYDAPRNAKSYFGGHMDGINLEWHLRGARKLGVQWSRCHDMLQYTWWTRVQPDGPDQWKWADRAQASADEAGFSTLGEFLWVPDWAAGGKPGDPRRRMLPPKDEEAFGRYVAGTVGHYRKSIHHWEVWNEPHYSGFWAGTPEDYAKLLAAAYREAKKADPGCFVLGGGGVSLGDMRWIEKMLKALPGKCMDGFSIHYLEPEAAAEQIGRLRDLLKARGIDVPIWDTEASVLTSSFLDQNRAEVLEPEARYHFRNACFEMVRMYMENIANGVQRVFYYELADPWRFKEFPKPRVPAHSPLGTGMWDEGRMLRPIGAAHAALAGAIEGKTYTSRVTSGALRAFVFEGKESATAVQYAGFAKFATRSTVRLPVPEGTKPGDFTRTDFMGNESPVAVEGGEVVLPLSREPVFLTVRGAKGGAVLQGMYAKATVPHVDEAKP